MSVTEQHEGWGKWDLTLKGLPDDTTPSEVWRALDPAVSAFGHIIITPTRIDPHVVGDAGLLSVARYTGIYRGTASRNQLTGVGLVAWLGDEDDKGDVATTAKTGGTGSFADWVDDVLPAAIEAGTITPIAGTLDEAMVYMSPRAMLARVMDYFGGTYRVNPDGTLDAGPEASLFATTPNHLLHWRGSGPDAGLHGLRPSTIDLSRDLEDYSTHIIMLAEGDGAAIAVGSATAGSVPFKDLHGNTVVRKRVVNAPDVSAGNANTLAAAQLGRFNKIRTSHRLATSEWGVAVLNRGGKRLEPGDYVWVYDSRPDAQLVDPANQVVFQGETITPVLMRLEGLTWPIQEGMGVYLRYYDDTTPVIVDLSPHVEWETGDATLEVGAAPRRLTEPTPAQAAVQGRVTAREFIDYSPSVSGLDVGTGSFEAGYHVDGSLVTVVFDFTFGGSSNWTGLLQLSLPFPPATRYDVGNTWIGGAHIRDGASASFEAACYIDTAGNLVVRALGTAGAIANYVSISNTVPMTWATGDTLRGTVVYEAEIVL